MGLFDEIDKEVLKENNTSNKNINNNNSTSAGLFDEIDKEVLQPTQTQPSVMSQIPNVALESAKQFGKRAIKSYPDFAKGLNDTVALLGDRFNNKALSSFGRKNANFWEDISNKIPQDPNYSGLQGLTGGWQKAIPTVLGEVGGQATNLGMAMSGGALGGLTARTLGMGVLGQSIGATAGTSIPNIAQEGSYLDKINTFRQLNGREPNEIEINKIMNTALAEKGINTALETISDKLLFNRIFPKGKIAGGVTGRIKNIVKNASEQAFTEGVTEGIQESVSVGAEKALGINQGNNLSRIGEAMAIGGLTGGVIGGAGSAIAKPYDTQFNQQPMVDREALKNVSAKIIENGKELYNSAIGSNDNSAFDSMRTLAKDNVYSNAVTPNEKLIEKIAPKTSKKKKKVHRFLQDISGNVYEDLQDGQLRNVDDNEITQQDNDLTYKEYTPSESEHIKVESFKYDPKISQLENSNNYAYSKEEVVKAYNNYIDTPTEENRETYQDLLGKAQEEFIESEPMFKDVGKVLPEVKQEDKKATSNDKFRRINDEHTARIAQVYSKYTQQDILAGKADTEIEAIDKQFEQLEKEALKEVSNNNYNELRRILRDDLGFKDIDGVIDTLVGDGKTQPNFKVSYAHTVMDRLHDYNKSAYNKFKDLYDNYLEKLKSNKNAKNIEKIQPAKDVSSEENSTLGTITSKQYKTSKMESKEALIAKAKDLGLKGNLKAMKPEKLQAKIKDAETKVDPNKEIWEGWTVQSFIDDLEPQINQIYEGNSIYKPFKNRQELKKWCMDNQPYYKNYIPDVVNYFANKHNIPNDFVAENVAETLTQKLTKKLAPKTSEKLAKEYIESKPTVEEYQQYGMDKKQAEDKISNSEKFEKDKAKIERKIARVGKDTMLGKKYQNELDQLVNEHQSKKALEKTDNIVNNDNTTNEHKELVNDKQRQETTTKTSRVAEKNEGSEDTRRSNVDSGRGDNSRLDSERGRGITSEDKAIVETKYKNQHELNKAIENYINNGEYEKYNGEIPEEVKNWLKSYAGAGGLEKQGAEGKGLLSEYYTPDNVVKKMWDLTEQYINTNGANVLEPSVGIGRFIEHAPEGTHFEAVEMNPVSAKITSLLYPNADVKVGEFQERFIDTTKNKPVKNVTPEYDIVIGNPPYGAYSGRYKGLGEGKGIDKFETYFITRGLDLLKENGVMTFIVPSGFLKSGNTLEKAKIAKKAEILEAFRLPEKTFKTTDIGTDIIVLRKTTSKIGNVSQFNADKYFSEHPENILGEVETRKNRFGKEETYVKGDKNAIDNIQANKNEIMETETVIEKHKPIPATKRITKKTKTQDSAEIKGNVEYTEYQHENKISDEDLKYFADTKVDGTLPKNKYVPGEKVNQFNGELYNDFNYMQGNIYEKLDTLEKEDISDKQRDLQRKKLESVLPKPKELKDIGLTPTSDFIREYVTTEMYHDPYTGIDQFKETSLDRKYMDYVYSLTNSERNGISSWDINKYVRGDRVDTRYYGNPTKEEKANQRAEFLTKLKNTVDKTFTDFLNTEVSDKVKKDLVDKWNRNFNGLYTPDYTKMPMIVKGLNSVFYDKKLKLQNVQVEGVNFLTNKGVGLLGFEVGVGKTLSGIISTVQNMQMGRCKKPLIIVPKQVKPNWINEIHEAFPNIKVNDLDNLGKFKGKIEDGTLSVATFQALDNLWYKPETIEKLKADTYSIRDKDFNRDSTERGREKAKERNEEFIGKAEAGNKKIHTIEDLGFDHITVDEAHNFKNLFGEAKADGQQGNTYSKITGAESTRAKRMFLATQYILNNNNNRNVFMLTATPFNNSPLEVFNMLSYLAKDKLDKMGIYNVYQFMENYVDIGADWVVDHKNEVVFKQIATGFKNLQSLRSVINSCMLIRSAEDAGIKRPNKHTKRVILEPTDEQLRLIAEAEAEAVGMALDEEGNLVSGEGKKKNDGSDLKAINKGRIATLSPDIYTKNLDVTPEEFVKRAPKLDYVCQAIASMKAKDPTTSQLVYMPVGVDFLPKLKQYFVDKGIYKSDEIALIKSGVNDDKISEITDSFNDENGKIKLVIGTNKMKEGMNLNKNSSVLYVPFMDWNPTDFLQVVGRIWRRGNKYNDIRVVVPLLKNSSDPFMFQKLDEKTSRINNIMDGDKDYIDTSELSTAEEKINMITNPDKKAKMFAQIEEQKLKNEKGKLEGLRENSQYYQNQLNEAEQNLAIAKEKVEQYKEIVKDIEDKNDYRYGYLESYKKDVSKYTSILKNVKSRIARLELDFNGKDSIENIDKQIESVEKKIENIKETTEKKRIEYQKEYETTRKSGKAIPELIKEFDSDTDSLYNQANIEIDLEMFNDNKSLNVQKTDYDNVDIAKAIKSNKTIGELCNTNELFYALKDELKDFSEYKIVNLTNVSSTTKGAHERESKTIYLNSEVLKTPQQLAETLFHEIEHIKQNQEYERIMELAPNERTNADNLFIKAFLDLSKSTKVMNDYRELHKAVIDDIMKDIQGFSKENLDNYLETLTPMKKQIITQHLRNSAEYYFNNLEANARNQGSNFAERIINDEKYSKTWNKRVGFNVRRCVSLLKQWTIRTNVWKTSREKINRQRQYSSEDINKKLLKNYRKNSSGIGLSGLRNIENELADVPTKETVNSETKISANDTTPQKKAKDEVRNWYAGIEIDRLDVNKHINSFINMSKSIAKDLSQKTGLNITDKMVREIMPFLRERTDIPEKLQRNDLKNVFRALSNQDKLRIRNLADGLSKHLEKYYENYKLAKGGEETAESVENHISHIWNIKNDKQRGILTNHFSTQSGFAKERTIKTLLEGINGIEKDGEIIYFVPKTLDYAEISKISTDSLIKATHDSILASKVKNLKLGKEKLVLPSSKAPSDWVEIDHPALSKWVYMGSGNDTTLMGKSGVKVHPDIANTLLTVFERQKIDGKFLRTYDTFNATLKQTTLGLSGFHGVALTESAIGNMGIKKTLKILNPAEIYKQVKSGNYSIYEQDSVARQAIKDGLQLGAPLDFDRNMVESFVDSSIGKIPGLGKMVSGAVKANNKILWNYLHNNYKLECYKLKVQELEEQGRNTVDNRRELCQWINDSFGGQVWVNLGVRPSQLKTAKRLLLSPDWLLSSVRQFMGLFSNRKVSTMLNTRNGQKEFVRNLQTFAKQMGLGSMTDNPQADLTRNKNAIKFWVTSVVFMSLFYNAINYINRKRDEKEHPEYYTNATLKDYTIWGNSVATDGLFDKMFPYIFIGRNSDGTARYLRLGKQFREVPELVSHKGLEKISAKSAPAIQWTSEVVTGMSPSSIVNKIQGKDAFLNQDIWNGYGSNATKKEGKELWAGRGKTALKKALPFIVQNATSEHHEFSKWDLFAQTSKGVTPYKLKNIYIEAEKRGITDLSEIDKRAISDGLSYAQVLKAKSWAKQDIKKSYTIKYQDKMSQALAEQNQNKINKVVEDMNKNKVPAQIQQKIYMKALKQQLGG